MPGNRVGVSAPWASQEKFCVLRRVASRRSAVINAVWVGFEKGRHMKVRSRGLCYSVLMLFLALGNTSQAATGFAGGQPWQIGDIIVCFGSGSCNVLRIVNGTPTLLDQFSDGLLGDTHGVTINNTLHLLVADNAGGAASDVVEYTIASVNPQTGVAVAHQLATNSPFNAAGANGQTLAVNASGQIFVGNAGNGSTAPSITELDPNGQETTGASPALVLPSNPFTLPTSCLDGNPPSVLSMDLSAAGDALYLTSNGGTIRKLTFSSANSGCTTFANFGANVTLYGIKDIPPGALANVSPNCKGTSCPQDEALLIAAIGNTDSDSGESGDNDSDAVNICTNVVDNNPVSCALLLDTDPNPGLNDPQWQAANQYFMLGASILDPALHVQAVYTAGTSANEEPSFSETGGLVIDNAVIWTDKGQPTWNQDTPYTSAPFPGTYIVDTHSNLQTVTPAGGGVSGHMTPSWNTSGSTVDGLEWSDQGKSVWTQNTQYLTTGTLISDPSAHAQRVIQAGTSGSGAQPSGGWNDTGGQTIEGVAWKESHPTWSPNSLYAVGALVMDSHNHVQQVQQAGTSGPGPVSPNFTQGGRTDDNTVTWVDIGQAVWRPSFAYGLNAIIKDSAGHVQQATTPGTSGPNQPTFVDGNSPGGTAIDGLQWQQSGTKCKKSCPSAWVAGTQYSAGTSITDGLGYVWNAKTAGTSGTAVNRPPFESKEIQNLTLADNAVVWADQGLLSISNMFSWQPSNAYVVNAEIIDTAQHVELVTVAGISGPGPSAPSFVDGGTVTDNNVIWADLGQAVWRANFSYGLNAIIVDGNGNVQQVTTAGTTGSSMPSFSNSPATDGSVVWNNRGPLIGSNFSWQAGFQYKLNAMIVDSNNHVELAINSGQSSAGPNSPAFADGGSVLDGLIWADQGQPAWIPDHAYLVAGIFIVDTNNNLETVSIPGISGHMTPGWQPAGTTIDGLIWADQGAWLPNHQYFSLGQPVGDSNGHVHAVSLTGTSGSGAQPAGGWNDSGGNNGGLTATGITIDNAVIWSESHPMWQANHTYAIGNSDTLILDSNNNVELATNDNPHSVGPSAVSGPSQPSVAGNNPWSTTTGGKTIDGLQWKNSSTTSSVVARYPVTGTTTLQSLTLNPLIRDCTVSNCSSTLSSPTTSNFWLADSQSTNFYKLDFASGTPTAYNANIPCGTCTAVTGIQGIGIYGGEGSNQPDLTKLASTSLSSPSYTAVTTFPPNVQQSDPSLNTWTLTAYKLPSAQAPIPITLYASLIPNAVPPPNGNNSGATDPSGIGSTGTLIGNVRCQPTTTDPTKCIIWKADLSMPNSTSYLSEVIGSPTGVDNGTDVFVDLHYDVTNSTGFGDLSTSGGSKGSVHSLQEIASQFTSDGANPSGCTYSSPVENTCYKTNRTTLNFTFQCSGLTQQQFLNLQNPPGPPDLGLVERFPTANPKPAPQTIFLSGTNSKAPYRYASSSNSYTFQWNLGAAETSGQINPNSTSTMRGCTFDPTGTVQTFCVDFTLDPACK